MSLSILNYASMSDLKHELARMLTNGINDPLVQQMTDSVIAGSPNPILSVFSFVQETFPYVPDPEDMELFTAPKKMAESYFAGAPRGEDCDGMALLTAAMMGTYYPVRIALVDSGFCGSVDHAFAEVYSSGLGYWMAVDTVSNLPLGWYVKNGRKEVVYPYGV